MKQLNSHLAIFFAIALIGPGSHAANGTGSSGTNTATGAGSTAERDSTPGTGGSAQDTTGTPSASQRDTQARGDMDTGINNDTDLGIGRTEDTDLNESAPLTAETQPEILAAPTESEIVSQIHANNQAEVNAGRLAMQKGTTPQIRRYGEQLIRDHQLADRMLLDVAKRQGLTVTQLQPRTVQEQMRDQEKMAKHQALQQANGSDFDRQFLAMMDQGHTETIGMLSQSHRNLPQSSELRGLIGKLIPILEQHDSLAQNLGTREGREG